MRPKLKGDTYYFPTPDGIYVRNNRDSCYLKGKILARLLDILSPYLNGEHTFDEIAANLPDDRQELLKKLIQTLIDRGFIQDASLDLPHQLTKRELQAYEAEIAFIGSFIPSAAYHFEQYRNARVLLIGSGLTLTALVHAALYSGLRQVQILLTDECPTDRQRLSDYLELYRERDGGQEVSFAPALDWTSEEATASFLQPFDVLLSITDCARPGRAQLLNLLAYKQQKVLLQAVLVGDSAWIGPLVQPGAKGCWECAWRYLQASFPAESAPLYAFSDALDVSSRFVAAPTAAVVANLLNFELFKHLTGTGMVETVGHLLAIDLETLQSKRHAFVPHPFCSACSAPVSTTAAVFQETIQRLRAAPAIEQEYFSTQATHLFDTQLGLFREIDEHDLLQIPLNVSQVTFVLPGASSVCTITESGLDFGQARRHATRVASEVYAAHFYDPRHGLSSAELQRAFTQLTEPFPSIYNRQLHSVERSGTLVDMQTRYLWAWNLTTETPAAVEAGAVFSSAQEPDILSDCSLTGVGSGMSWDEAIYHALLDLVCTQALRASQQALTPFPHVHLTEIALSPIGERLRHLLDLMPTDLMVYDLSSKAWGFPCFFFSLAGKPATCVCDCDAAQALQTGLEQVLLEQQLGSGYLTRTLQPGDDLPSALRGSAQAVPLQTCTLNLAERNTALCAALREGGFVPLALPLDHHPALAQVLPFLVRIVLGDISSERDA